MISAARQRSVGYKIERAIRFAKKYALRNMQSTVIISRMEMHPERVVESFPYPKELTETLRVLYTGPARIYAAADSQMDYAGEEQVFSTVYISTPIEVDGEPLITQANDMIEVTDHPDPMMNNRWFRVVTVETGGQFPTVRRHTVTGAARFAEWTYVEETP